MKYTYLLSFLLITMSCSTKTSLESALASDSKFIKTVMSSPENYEIQILYSQIKRSDNGEVSFIDHNYNLNDNLYFYPASSVKFPVALIALEKLKKLQQNEIPITKNTLLLIGKDSIHTSIANAITKVFAISDNDAYNHLFEFLGQEKINTTFKNKNLKARITHRLSTENAFDTVTKPILFKKNIEDTLVIYKQVSITNPSYPPLEFKAIKKGKGFIKKDRLIHEPMDFSAKNYLPISTLHKMMKRIQFPENFSEKERFDITKSDRDFILNAMKTLPKNAGYTSSEYYDGFVKFFMFGDTKEKIPDHIEIFNKVGYAYGYLTDCAYIRDSKNDIEFILTATIHVNKNKIFNDDTYEYDEIGIPFIAQLGREIHKLEKENTD